MTTISQIKGMLLEEAILHLLRTAGYNTIESDVDDPTLHVGSAGLEVRGRGAVHQVDALAEYCIDPPFSYPQRLIVEAKCYSSKYTVRLPVIRNAVGVLKDVTELSLDKKYHNQATDVRKYSYRYAVFSASGYSPKAECYAFAHDIYLIQYWRSPFMHPVISAIQNIGHADFNAANINSIDINLTDLRKETRNVIRSQWTNQSFEAYPSPARRILHNFIQAVLNIGGTLLAIADKRFLIHLIPSPNIQIAQLAHRYDVQIRLDGRSWYLVDRDNRMLFSFDLPIELFRLYTEQGLLTREGAIRLKSEKLNTLQALLVTQGEPRIITFDLDRGWILELYGHIKDLQIGDERLDYQPDYNSDVF